MPTNKTAPGNQRALEIWPHLIAQALQRRPITFGVLAAKVGIPKAPLALISSLDKLCAYCTVKGIPQLPILVVAKNNGEPGFGKGIFPDVLGETEKVFNFDWSQVPGPSLTDIAYS